MIEYIVNYDVQEFPNIFDAILHTFKQYNDFINCKVEAIYVPVKSNFLMVKGKTAELHGYPVFIDMDLHEGQFIITMDSFPNKEKENLKENSDIYYLVTIKTEYQDKLFYTTISKGFCGKILQHASTMIFELNSPTKAQVIIPFSWIESMAPSKAHWEKRGK